MADGGGAGRGRALCTFSEPSYDKYTHDLIIFFLSRTKVVEQDLGFSYFLYYLAL